MRRAIRLARRGLGRTAPNPMVGAVVVKARRAVGEGWHREYGQPHAEPEALRAAGDAARDATLYVSLEPCSHWGKTPPCTEAIIAAGVKRVVFAASDPNPRASGGAARLRAAGLEVGSGVLEEQARDLNAAFFFAHSPGGSERPWVTLKLALSLDGATADAWGRSQWITGGGARHLVHRLRAGHEAVAVGSGTALADDPLLTVRGDLQPRVAPIRVVWDRRLRLPVDGQLARTAWEVPVWVIGGAHPQPSRRAALEAVGVRVLPADDIPGALRAIRAAGVRSLFCEGGRALASALLQAEVVDRLELFIAPFLLGGSAPGPFRDLPSVPLDDPSRWRRLAARGIGPDTLIRLARR